jgi:FKBP-type peptidyl-prolyl cis-trans isomerase
MRTIFFAVIFSLGVAGFAGCASKPRPDAKASVTPIADTSASTNLFSDDKSKASYAIGMIFAHNLQQQGVDADATMLLRGLKDEESGGATLLTPQEAQNTVKEFQQKMRAELAVKNKAAGEAFFATNKNNPGVVTLPDGLQYKVITAGSGAMPAADSTVTVNYRGTFLNGAEFDSSARAGHPVQFLAGRVIRGWSEALMQMRVGSKWQLFIPSGLAYGEQGRPGIPPNATLVFEVELLGSQNPPSQPPPASPAAPLTSDIIRVPSAEEMKKGAKIETLTPEEVEKLQSQSRTN